jgi:DNA-binding transcriptional LysR family regulator
MRSLNLDQLRAFIEVIERGSITAAAKELNLTQPAITHQLQELERRFGVPLTDRIGKRIYLTEAGEKLIEHARHLLDEDARTVSAMRRFGDGWLERVRIGTSATVLMYALPPILQRLKTEHPQLEINLKAGLTAGTLQMLKDNALDLGICALPLDDPAFEVTPLLDDELVAILPDNLGAAPKRVTPAFLAGLPLILGNESSALRRTIAGWLAQAGPPPKPVMEFDNVEAIKSLVAVGLGASIVPRLSLGGGHVSADHMRVVPLSPRLSRRVGLVELRGKRTTEGVKVVADALLALRQGGKTVPKVAAQPVAARKAK